jgi:hypothetical protein
VFSEASRPAVGPTQPPNQGAGWGVNLTVHFHPVSSLRNGEAILLFPHTPLWRAYVSEHLVLLEGLVWLQSHVSEHLVLLEGLVWLVTCLRTFSVAGRTCVATVHCCRFSETGANRVVVRAQCLPGCVFQP